MDRNNESSREVQSPNQSRSRRSFIKTGSVALSTIGLGHSVAATSLPKVSLNADTDPDQQKTENSEFTTCSPDYCAYGQSVWINHRGTFEYYGMTPRPSPTGTDKWGHIFRITGRGESVAYSSGQSKEDGDYYPYLTGHGINFHDWSSGTSRWVPGEEQNDGKIAASPAEGEDLSQQDRAESAFETLLSETPGLGTIQTLNSLLDDLSIDRGAKDDFHWELDSLGAIDYEHTPATDHFIEFEARAKPGALVDIEVDTKTYLTYKLEAESPVGLRGSALIQTKDDPVPSSTAEAIDYGFDFKPSPKVANKYDTSNREYLISADEIDVEDIIIKPPEFQVLDLVELSD
ncbi:hypothetical protein [Halorhabdus rudnickae]|uniref:hypothetical protein n=1 Tax=Halorhabdus rudnickae TaxID=1775544 RepID=UPI001083790E|nr:hypothetical protein [Halorhabdus rudnickae]